MCRCSHCSSSLCLNFDCITQLSSYRQQASSQNSMLCFATVAHNLLCYRSAIPGNSLWHDAYSMVLFVFCSPSASDFATCCAKCSVDSAHVAEECDEDVQQYCQQALTAPRAGVWGIGTAGRCLSKSLAEGQYMAQGCKNLVIAAAPKVSCCP